MAFCLYGKGTSILAPQFVIVLAADPSANTLVLASCRYVSAVAARVRDCFISPSCVSPLKREGTVALTLIPVMSVTKGPDKITGKGMGGGVGACFGAVSTTQKSFPTRLSPDHAPQQCLHNGTGESIRQWHNPKAYTYR